MQLSRNFRLEEFHGRDGAPVPRSAINELRELCQRYLQPLRDTFGRTIVHSGHRSRAHNASVDGAPQSFHRYDLPSRQGVAADVSCARGTPAEWFAYLDRLDAPGLHAYSWGVHVDNRRDRARW